MIKGIRGLAQAFISKAVGIGRGAAETFTTLVESGLGYVQEQFTIDWQTYDQQKAFLDLASGLDKDQLLPGAIHGESQLNLTTRYQYKVKAVYEDLRGRTVTKHWSVSSDVRLSQTEIEQAASVFAEDYGPEEFPFHSEPEITGIWTRAEAGI